MLDFNDYGCSLHPKFVRIRGHGRRRAVTLTELLCVLAIISILMAMYLPSIARAYAHARKVLGLGD